MKIVVVVAFGIRKGEILLLDVLFLQNLT